MIEFKREREENARKVSQNLFLQFAPKLGPVVNVVIKLAEREREREHAGR